MAQVADQRHRVRDEEAGEAVTGLEIAEQVDDLGADRDIEGADRFVKDEELRAERDCAGDVDALALAAGEGVRVTGESGGVEADLGEEGSEAGFEAFGWALVVDPEGFREGLANGHAGDKRGVGVLEDDGEMAAQAAQGAGFYDEEVEAGCVSWVVDDLTGGRLDEAKDYAGDGALAGAGFPDKAECFAATERKGDVIDDADGAVLLTQVDNLEQRRGWVFDTHSGQGNEMGLCGKCSTWNISL